MKDSVVVEEESQPSDKLEAVFSSEVDSGPIEEMCDTVLELLHEKVSVCKNDELFIFVII